MKVLTEERHQLILQELYKNKIIKNDDLANKLKTSLSTIRRDLQELEANHQLTRIHGGAKLIDNVLTEDSMSEKSSKNHLAKQQIATIASQIINDGDFIFLDAGSTTFEMIPHLEKYSNLTVVTNSILHAFELTKKNIPTHIIGGKIKHKTQAIINSTALCQMKQLHFDLSFIGTNAIHNEFGLMTPDIEEGNLKQLAINHSQKAYVLADHSKFNQISSVAFEQLDKVTIFTDYIPQTNKKTFLSKTTIKEIDT